MATGTKSDFQIHDELFFGGFNEVIQQNSNAFNEASMNGMRLVPRMLKGEFEKESFFQSIDALVQHRDPTSTSTAPTQKLEQGELTGVKLNRRIGPAEQTMDAFKKIQVDPEEFSFVIGQQAGEEALRDYLDTGILAAETALNTEAGLVTDIHGSSETDKQMRTQYLIRTMQNFGDRSGRIVAWAMHSKPWFDLMEHQATQGYTNVSDVIIFGGSPGTLGKPVIVTDSDALVEADPDGDTSAATRYTTLGLVSDGIVLNQSEEENILSDTVLGNDNIIMQYQGEYAYNLKVKGFDYTGAAAPNDSTLGTASNWNFVMNDTKLAAGVVLLTE